jgi:hypothetical protein
VYEPGEVRGVAVVSYREGIFGRRRYKTIHLRRPRLVRSGFVSRSARFRPLCDTVDVAGRPRTVLAYGCEGRSLAIHLA